MAVKIKHKRGTASNIGTANPTLASGELGFETDTLRFKLGDGTTAWDSLAYVKPYVSTTDRLLGRSTAGAGVVEEITCTAFGRSLIDDADAAAARTTLGVQPTASPAFTGNATITASSGIPLTLNGNSTALRIEEGSGETIDIYRAASDGLLYLDANQQTFSGFVFRTTPTGGSITSALMIGSSQRVTLYNQLLVTAGSASAPGVAISGDPNTGMFSPSADVLAWATAGSERVRVDASGNVGIGAAVAGGSNKVQISGTLPSSGTVTRAILCNGLIPSGGSAFGETFVSFLGTAAESFTCSNLRHFVAAQGSLGAGSSITNQYGYVAEFTLTGATNNYGFYSNIASGSGRWNFYSNGTAPSFFGGQLLVTAGSASAPGVAFSGDPDTGMFSPGADQLALSTNQTERLLIDASGNIRINGAAAATSAVGAIHLKNGTAPTASITDGVVLFAADVTTSELRVRDEAGNTTTLSPHAFPLIPEGPSEPMAWAYYSERDGRRINVDMLRVVRLLEQLTGEKLVYED